VSSYQPYGSVFCCAHVHIEESNEKRDKSSGADLNDLKRQLRNMESQHQVRSVSMLNLNADYLLGCRQ
jgi:hypothetical protein